MFPLMVIGGVIGAVMSIAKGTSWVSDQLDSSKTSAAAGGKANAAPVGDTNGSSFESKLAAQTAGQTVPVAAPSTPAATPVAVAAPSPAPATPVALIPHAQPTEYDALARMKAGVEVYNNVGQHHGNHAGAIKQSTDQDGVTAAQS